MFKNVAILETDQCVKKLESLFATQKELFKNTLFIVINPFHQIKLKELDLTFVLSSELINDASHLTAATQITQWVEQFENSNASLKEKKYGHAVLFEFVFYLQFLLGHALFLMLLFAHAQKKYPSLERFLKINKFVHPGLKGPYLCENESAIDYIAAEFFPITLNLTVKGPIKTKDRPVLLKKFALKLAAQVQKMHLKILTLRLKHQEREAAIMVNNHKALYSWVSQKCNNNIWLIKNPVNDCSWARIIGLIVTPLVQHLLPNTFKIWTQKNYQSTFRYVIDPTALIYLADNFRINSEEQLTLSEQVLHKSTFNFVLDKNLYPGLQGIGIGFLEKAQKGLLPYVKNLEICFLYLDSFLDSNEVKSKAHFYNHDNTALSGFIGEASFLYDINSTLVTHGSHPVHQDKQVIQEFIRHGRGLFISRHKFTAIQSAEARKFAELFIKDSTPVETGPVSFGKMPNDTLPGTYKKQFFGNENIQMYIHAGTYKPRNSTRFLIYETVDEYVRNLNALITNINELNLTSVPRPIKLIIKIRPTNYLNSTKLAALLQPSAHVAIEEKIPFLNLLSDAEGVISFSSTTIEEALLNKKSVLLQKRDNFSFLMTETWPKSKHLSLDRIE